MSPPATRTRPLAELQRLLAGGDERVAVLRDERIVGVVTRSDLLRALGEQAAPTERPGPMLTDQLARLDRLQPVFEAVAAVSEPFEGVYLVGGTVRDILLGERELRRRHRGRGRRDRPRPGARRRARRARAGPREVRHRGRDLRRRRACGRRHRADASSTTRRPRCRPSSTPRSARTSSAATSRSTRWRSRSRAPTSAGSSTRSRDGAISRRRPIRVLHNLSFIDDPTRIFRAIRYENRYGFRMDEHTLRLARGAIEMGLVGDLSSARLRDELDRAARGGRARALDPAPGRARRRPGDPPAPRGRRRGGRRCSRRLTALRDRYGLAIPVLAARSRRARARACRPTRSTSWLAAPEGAPPRRASASRPRSPSARGSSSASRAGAEPAEVVALAEPYRAGRAAVRARPGRPAAAARLLRAAAGRAARGRAAPTSPSSGLDESPRVGEILAELRRRKLNGELDGRDSELAAARELIAAVIRWEHAPARTRSSFSTRDGGVSERRRSSRSTSAARPTTSRERSTRTGAAPVR